MSRKRSLASRLGLAIAVAGLGAVACGETTENVDTSQTFHRPIDIAFACHGGLRLTDGDPALPITTAQPVRACEIRSGARIDGQVPVPIGQEGDNIGGALWWAFILQSAPGTVMLAQFPTEPSRTFVNNDQLIIVDADPLTPGRNGISVGEDPIAIATDKVGCYEVVANAGSCDLSVLDINSAIDTFDPAVRVDRIPITNAAGEEMLARPVAMVADAPGGEIGVACPAQATGIVYVAYPQCHLVAAVDSSNGQIVAGIDYASGTPTLTDGNVSCPAECGGGGTFTAGIRPVALDLERDERNGATRLLIGADNSPAMTLVEIGVDGLPMSLRPLLLEDTLGNGQFGVTAVALGPQIGMGGSDRTLNDDLAVGGQFQFAYGIATDRSIRVVDIFTGDRECDTQVDPRLIDGVRNVRELSCFPVGAPATPARRANARGPGIRLPGPVHDVIPISIEIFRAFEPGDGASDARPDSSQETLLGYFAMVTGANGATYIIDVDDDQRFDFKDPNNPLTIPLPLAIAHHVRDSLDDRALINVVERDDDMNPATEPLRSRFCDDNGPDPDSTLGNRGGSRATAPPTRNVPSGVVAAEKVPSLPYLRQVLCEGTNDGGPTSEGGDTTRPVSELSFSAPDDVRDMTFQDVMELREETWTMTYEGPLSLDTADGDIDGPPIRTAEITVDTSGMHLADEAAKPFCAAGAEQFDIVQLRGCDPSAGDGNGECPVGYTCFVHPNSQIAGMGACMLADEADRLADACKDFLTSSRRYTVGRAESGRLRLQPRRRMLRQTPLDGCTDDAQCTALADYAAELATAGHPVDNPAASSRSYTCVADPDRPPLDGPGQTGKRCIEACDDDTACSAGGICRGGVCYEGVIPPQSCVNAPQRFELRSHDAFTVIGSRSGYIHATIEDPASQRCVRDPAAHQLDVGRIPLRAAPCDPTADLRTGRRPDGTFEPNPCSTTIDHEELVPSYVPGTCTLADPANVLVNRQVPALRYRNRGFMVHLVDPTYPGDAVCNRDRAGTLPAVPIVFGNYQLSWRQTGGLNPMTLVGVDPAFPVKVIRGPVQSIWVVDEGDFLSTSVTQDSTRGRVYRIEAIDIGNVVTME